MMIKKKNMNLHLSVNKKRNETTYGEELGAGLPPAEREAERRRKSFTALGRRHRLHAGLFKKNTGQIDPLCGA